MLNELHEGHTGMSKTESMARSYMWWPNTDRDIESRICLLVLRFYGPVNPMGSCRARSVTQPHVYWAGLVLLAVNQYFADSFTRNRQSRIEYCEIAIRVPRYIPGNGQRNLGVGYTLIMQDLLWGKCS